MMNKIQTNTAQARISILCAILGALGLGVIISLSGISSLSSLVVFAMYLIGALPATLFTVFAQRQPK
jgi:hypothetical protein